MKVILLENVRKVGSIGEIIDVKRGFARNYLISKKKALFASKENIKEVEKIKTDLAKKDNEKKTEAQKYIVTLFTALANDSEANLKKGLKYLVKESQTPKGLNEQGLKEMNKKRDYKSEIKLLLQKYNQCK